MKDTFKCFEVSETNGVFSGSICKKNLEDLPDNDTLVKVSYSGLNYKDALSANGNRGVTKKYPHTPGIDAAGTVIQSSNPDFQPGDEVIVTSFDLGMNTPGGFSEFIRVPSEWIVKLPKQLILK